MFTNKVNATSFGVGKGKRGSINEKSLWKRLSPLLKVGPSGPESVS